jgi:hypothetical protein
MAPRGKIIYLNAKARRSTEPPELKDQFADLLERMEQRTAMSDAETAVALSDATGFRVTGSAVRAWRNRVGELPGAALILAIERLEISAGRPTSRAVPESSNIGLLFRLVEEAPPPEETVQLARAAIESGATPAMLEGIETAVERYGREYSGTPPRALIARLQQLLREIESLRGHRLHQSDLKRLEVASGWTYLLLAATRFDIGDRSAAEAAREAAEFMGQETGNPEITAWALETAAWWSNFEGRWRQSLDFAVEGARLAPIATSARVMNLGKQLMTHGRMRNIRELERVLESAAEQVAKMPKPLHPDNHFVFDAPKLAFYAATAYAWAGDLQRAASNARDVIERAGGPGEPGWVPTRVAISRLDLASALVGSGDLDEASGEAGRAFDAFVRNDTLIRASELAAQMEGRWPRSKEPGILRERISAARQSLAGTPRGGRTQTG